MYNALTILTQAIRTSDLGFSSGGSGGGGGGGTGVAGPTLTDYIGKWSMDTVDTTATLVTDTGTGGYDMTLVNAPTISAPGQKAQSVTFSKWSVQYGVIPKAATSGLTDFTISFWFNTSYTSQAGSLMEHYHNTGGIASGISIQISHTGIVGVAQGAGTGVVVDTDLWALNSVTTGLNDGNWHHISYTYDLSTTTAKLIIDGILEQQRLDVTGIAWPSTVEWGIGATLGSFPLYIGSIDEIKLFNYDLTNVQVEDIYIQDGGVINLVAPTDYTGYFTMDTANLSGATMADLGSKGLDMTLVNSPVTGSAGKVGESIYFDLASSTYATVPNAMLYNEADMGIGLWFNSLASTSQTLVSTYSLESGDTVQFGMQIILTNAGALSAYIAGGTGLIVGTNIDIETSDTVGLNDGTWHHVLLTYNAATTTMRLYVDGLLEKNNATVAGLAHHTSRDLYVAQDPAGAPSLVAAIDNIKVYDYAPTNQEVLAIYRTDGGV